MDTIFLYNQRKENFPTEVIRYFILNGKRYFIFTLNEKDSNGYVQLYVSRIEDENGHLVMKNITDENEWSIFKSAIQTIVTNNRNSIRNVGDLDFNELNNMTVTEFRIFKLKENVSKELGMNKNVEVKKIEPKTLEAASAQNNDFTIEQILRQVSEGAKSAREVSKVNLSDIVKSVENSKDVVSKPVPAIVKPISIEHEENKPISNTNEYIDYKKKYEESLSIMKKLESENVKLINELVDAKAKLETIKDLLNVQ